MYIVLLSIQFTIGSLLLEDINIDRGPQQTLTTENPWLNVIITHSLFIFRPFICLFLTIIALFYPFLSSLY